MSSSCKFFTDENGVVHPIRSTCDKKKKGLPGTHKTDMITKRKRKRTTRSPSPPTFSPPPSPVRSPPRPKAPSLSSDYYPGFKSRAEPSLASPLRKMREDAMMGKGVGRLKKTQDLLAEANKLMERDFKGKKTFLKRKKIKT
jgi:hypothetical protein